MRPGIEDAAEIVGLMDSILERVYQEPARVAKIRTKRERRQQNAAQGGAGRGRTGRVLVLVQGF